MRAWIYGQLSSAPTIQAFVDDRILQGGSLTEAPPEDDIPFLVYRMGAQSPKLRGRGAPGERNLPMTKYFQVWAHDRSGDYLRIDAILKAVREVLENQEEEAVQWIEESRDLRDQDLNTIIKYSRYTIITSR